jgi:anti-sigma regulatory factor (Ser/Thr protein kinase)
MPEMDGFQLVSKMRELYPIVPVIIITARGSEEMAMEALRKGAASYCPKSRMSRDLVSIARNVLSVSVQRRQSQQVLTRITRSSISFRLENDSRLIAPTIEHLQSHMVGWDETDRLRIGVALDESLLNAMHHGNLEVDSRLRDVGDGSSYQTEIDKRNQVQPFRDRRVEVHAEISEAHIKVCVRDEGPGFAPESVADPTDAENLGKPSGRGLLLIRTFMSDVIHNDCGNEITMVKHRESEMAG